jgi:16S rRNA processing protein RimM
LLVEAPEGKYMNLKIEECSFYKDKIVVKFYGYDSWSDVSQFIGKKLFVKRKDLPHLQDGEYYWMDILDMKVYTFNDEYLGKVEDIMDTGSNDVFIVRDGSNEILIPVTKEVLKKIDYEQNSIIVELIEGLI